MNSTSENLNIENILKTIERKFNNDYWRGFDDGKKEALKEIFVLFNKRNEFLSKIFNSTLVFKNIITEKYPSIIVEHLMVGVDYATNLPVSLLVLDEKSMDYDDEISDIAFDIKHVLLDKGYPNLMFWNVYKTASLDLDLLNNDFHNSDFLKEVGMNA